MTFPVAPTIMDRLWASFRVLARAEDPNRDYRGVWEYAVQATDGTTIDAIPTDPSVPMPQLTKVRLRYGIPGTTSKPLVGSLLAIGFLNSDPTKPICFGVYDSQVGPGLSIVLADTTSLGIPPKPVARVGDAVGPFVITTGSPFVNSG
jgi:hypothetical protein